MCRSCILESQRLNNKTVPDGLKASAGDTGTKIKLGVNGKPKMAVSNQFNLNMTEDFDQVLEKQLNGQRYVKLNESGSIYLIPGENPDFGMMCGTNVYAIGTGQKRYMIDACVKDHAKFLRNVKAFVQDQNCYFEGIFVTHAHHDHMDGAQNVVDLMLELGLPKPKVYKKVDGNPSELQRIESSPDLVGNLYNTREPDVFQLEDNIRIFPIETPGHISDHLCFLMQEGDKYSLFTGDHVVGATSTFFTDYPAYFKSLLKTEKVINDFKVEKLYVAHSQTLYPKDIALDAKTKIHDYIQRRVKKDQAIEILASKLQSFTVEEFYRAQQKDKKVDDDLTDYFLTILERQLEKLVADGKYVTKGSGKTKLFIPVTLQAKL